jgi:hypothetical protein
MNTRKPTKINQLISTWNRGTVYTQFYLSSIGYNHDLVKGYKRSGWLQTIGTGAYVLPNDRVDIFGGLFALQRQLHLSVHIGSRTALELKGYAHYARTNATTLFILSKAGCQLPKWFMNHDWGVNFYFKTTNLISQEIENSLTKYEHKDFEIKISSPERAALEMLYLVPKNQGFDEASHIMENLTTLRPELVQKLLESCNSIKAKRLFLYLSEKHNHDWFAQLDLSKVNLGSGKRVIIKGGKLDSKYKIVVPQERNY